MYKAKRLAIILLSVLLLASVGYTDWLYEPPFDDAEAYIQALEDAMDARYGSREEWPQGFDTLLAVVKYFSGQETTYESTLSWATAELKAKEAMAVSDASQSEAARDFVYALNNELTPPDLHGFAWPYEARALITAAFRYVDEPWYDILPTENDLPEEEAVAIAREAIQKEYNLSDIGIDQYEIYTAFFMDTGEGSPFWRVVFGLNDYGYELYYAYIASPSGEVLRATRNDGMG